MANLYQFSEVEMLAFVLVLLRLSAFVVSWPIFGVSIVPTPSKILLALAVALMIFPAVDWSQIEVDISSNQIIWLAIREIFIGLTLGFLGRLFLYALNIAGEIISVSMGLASAQLFNPALGDSASATQQVFIALGTLFLLAIEGHHVFLTGLAKSFDLVPLSAEMVSLQAYGGFGEVVQTIMEIGLQMSAPVLIAILFMNLAMAVIGRAVPQINVLITSLPVNILVGFLVMIISLPLFIGEMNGLMEVTTTKLFQILKSY